SWPSSFRADGAWRRSSCWAASSKAASWPRPSGSTGSSIATTARALERLTHAEEHLVGRIARLAVQGEAQVEAGQAHGRGVAQPGSEDVAQVEVDVLHGGVDVPAVVEDRPPQAAPGAQPQLLVEDDQGLAAGGLSQEVPGPHGIGGEPSQGIGPSCLEA